MKKGILAALIMCAMIAVYAEPCICAAAAVKVAFIDSGISTKHIAATSVLEGKNYVFPEQDTNDRTGHGTAVAGAVLGSEELNIVGSCPSALAVPLVAYDKYPSEVVENGGIKALCEAIYDAVDLYGCRVINISMGVPSESEDLFKAILYAEEHDVVVVSAVGNDNLTFPQRVYYPAAYKTVIGVGAADGMRAADFSQRNAVSVLANGKSIPVVGNRNVAQVNVLSGTSYACAYVSGLCAKLLTENPSLTAAQTRTLLFASAEDVGKSGFDDDSGFGIVGATTLDDDTVTRVSFAQQLYIAENEPMSNKGYGFADVTEEMDEAGAIFWATENYIINGISQTEFAPYEPITREQMATIAYRYFAFKINALTASDKTSYKDNDDISDYAKEAVSWATDEKIMLGYPDGSFVPKGNITRMQANAVLQRLFKRINAH